MTSPAPDPPKLVSVKHAADHLGFITDDIYEMVKAGHLAHYQAKPGAKIHILAADLDRWVAENVIAKRGDVA